MKEKLPKWEYEFKHQDYSKLNIPFDLAKEDDRSETITFEVNQDLQENFSNVEEFSRIDWTKQREILESELVISAEQQKTIDRLRKSISKKIEEQSYFAFMHGSTCGAEELKEKDIKDMGVVERLEKGMEKGMINGLVALPWA